MAARTIQNLAIVMRNPDRNKKAPAITGVNRKKEDLDG
jgi:hypothetical protein